MKVIEVGYGLEIALVPAETKLRFGTREPLERRSLIMVNPLVLV